MQNVVVHTLYRLVYTRKLYKDFYSNFGELISVQNFEQSRGIWFPVIMQNNFGGKVFFFKVIFYIHSATTYCGANQRILKFVFIASPLSMQH